MSVWNYLLYFCVSFDIFFLKSMERSGCPCDEQFIKADCINPVIVLILLDCFTG